MRKIVLFLILSFAVYFVHAAQPLVCTEAGTEFEYAIYDGKGKITGYKIVRVDEVVTNEQGERNVKNRIRFFDKAHGPVVLQVEGKSVPSEQLQYFALRDSEMVLSLNELLSGLPLDSEVGMSISGDEYTLPYAMDSGVVLPDLGIVLSLTDGDRKIDMKIKISDRQFLGSEQLTTPAGTFDAFKVRERTRLHFLIMNVETCSVAWYATEIGVVREEMF